MTPHRFQRYGYITMEHEDLSPNNSLSSHKFPVWQSTFYRRAGFKLRPLVVDVCCIEVTRPEFLSRATRCSSFRYSHTMHIHNARCRDALCEVEISPECISRPPKSSSFTSSSLSLSFLLRQSPS